MLARALSLRLSASQLASMLVAIAVGASAIVFAEPAVADVLMLGVIVALPVLGTLRFGPVSLLNLVLWLCICALGLAVAMVAATTGVAVVHQLVTLFLACGAFVLAGFVAEDPEPRFHLIMRWYVVACLIATLAAFVGYFNIVPSAYDLFTNYGRARGTFKDPNVYGAALAPAIVYCAWMLLRSPKRHALLAAAVSLPLAVGLLITFSRGAWISTCLSLAILGWFAYISGRRRTDRMRMLVVAIAGSLALALALGAVLQLKGVEDLFAQRANLDQGYDSGPEGRFGGQRKAFNLVAQNPLGIGTFTFSEKYHSEDVHNVYLTMFLNAGWLGGVLYIFSVAVTLFVAFRGALRLGSLHGPFLVAAAAFAGVAFEGMVIDSDHWRHFFLLMGLIWGLADARAPMIDRTRRRTDRAAPGGQRVLVGRDRLRQLSQ